ncbi:MAG: hypothetical protein Ct9H300mP32_0030 [Verrucomicrobiota bacterium]|nr:MAG: hypothetical protein Ct9H300mP32_0030 [Verrucomicrobiota bacterium]
MADFDSDGNEDVFLSQNFFAVAMRITGWMPARGCCCSGTGRAGS